jgi:hypothetical protein
MFFDAMTPLFRFAHYLPPHFLRQPCPHFSPRHLRHIFDAPMPLFSPFSPFIAADDYYFAIIFAMPPFRHFLSAIFLFSFSFYFSPPLRHFLLFAMPPLFADIFFLSSLIAASSPLSLMFFDIIATFRVSFHFRD